MSAYPVRHCKRCVLPSTKPGLLIDEEGVCSACRQVERKKLIDWDAREAELAALCDSIRGKNGNGYDCIVPVSGGKDSTYQVWVMSKVHGLKVLAVNVVAHLQTREGIHNLNAMVEHLNVDLIKVNVRPTTLKKIRNSAFFKIGNPNWAEHRVIFAAVARTALLYHVPLVAWGEDIAVEFGGNRAKSVTQEGSAEELINNDLFREATLEDLLGTDVRPSELLFYMHPDKDELKRRGIRSIYLGHYRWWDGTKHYLKAKEFGFRPRREGPLSGNILDYDNIDEKLCEVNIWFKFLKHGFWRPHDQSCYKIWNGYMSREEAVDLIHAKQYEFPIEYFQEYLEYHEMTERQFRDNEDKWRNPRLWHLVKGEWRLRYPIEQLVE